MHLLYKVMRSETGAQLLTDFRKLAPNQDEGRPIQDVQQERADEYCEKASKVHYVFLRPSNKMLIIPQYGKGMDEQFDF